MVGRVVFLLEEYSMMALLDGLLPRLYLGEPDALAEAFGKESLRPIGAKARFRKPDDIPYPARALARLVPQYQKVGSARVLANHLDRQRNRSPSFRAMMDGIE